MKVLFVCQNQKAQNRASYTSISSSFIRSFNRLGIECDPFDLTLYNNRYLGYLKRKIPFLYQSALQKINDELIKTLLNGKYTHLFVLKGFYLLSDTLKKVKTERPDLVSLCFNPDDPFNVRKGVSHKQILAAIPHYDHYFIWKKTLVGQIRRLGVDQVHYLPFAADPEIIYPKDDVVQDLDLVFIGNGDKERETWLNECVKHNTTGIDIHVFGNNWNKISNIKFHEPKVGKEFLETMARGKMHLNILRLQNKNSTNMRTFELPASKSFMFHEESSEARALIEDKTEAVYFSDAKTLMDYARYYLEHEEERKAIAEAGYKKVSQIGFSYDDRTKEIIKCLGESMALKPVK